MGVAVVVVSDVDVALVGSAWEVFEGRAMVLLSVLVVAAGSPGAILMDSVGLFSWHQRARQLFTVPEVMCILR